MSRLKEVALSLLFSGLMMAVLGWLSWVICLCMQFVVASPQIGWPIVVFIWVLSSWVLSGITITSGRS